nr:T cell receptor alpha [Tachyglossus aculeatus]
MARGVTATLLLLLSPVLPNQVTQLTSVEATAGHAVNLQCKHTSLTSSPIFWYQQMFNQAPELVLSGYSSTRSAKAKLTIQEDRKSNILTLHNVQDRDSAVYYCALDGYDSGNKVIFGKGTSLTVTPNVTNPQPRMYRLKKPQVNDLSICLFTDFGNDEVNMTGIRNIMRAPSVVDVKRLESKSLGIVAWDNSLDWDCQAQASEAVYSLSNSSGKVCNAKVVNENFSSDPYLNSRNLAMIFLRVVFVKTMGFNLLMTLKLWSS